MAGIQGTQEALKADVDDVISRVTWEVEGGAVQILRGRWDSPTITLTGARRALRYYQRYMRRVPRTVEHNRVHRRVDRLLRRVARAISKVAFTYKTLKQMVGFNVGREILSYLPLSY